MDLSAKIYFDQVSAPFYLTPWLSLFLRFPLIYCALNPSFFVKQLYSTGLCFFYCMAWCPAVIFELKALSHVFQSQCLCAALILASVSQTTKQWLIEALESDLRIREHARSHSNKSCCTIITGYLIWAMLYKPSHMEKLRMVVGHSDSVGLVLIMHAVKRKAQKWM